MSQSPEELLQSLQPTLAKYDVADWGPEERARWWLEAFNNGKGWVSTFYPTGSPVIAIEAVTGTDESVQANAELIPEAVNALPAVCAALVALIKERDSLREALTPSAYTKTAYRGEFTIPIEFMEDDETAYTEHLDVPWTTIKEIMATISNRARQALSSTEGGAS